MRIKKYKNTAFENFKLFPENQPPNKIGSNNDKQIKLYETDGKQSPYSKGKTERDVTSK